MPRSCLRRLVVDGCLARLLCRSVGLDASRPMSSAQELVVVEVAVAVVVVVVFAVVVGIGKWTTRIDRSSA